MEVKEIPAHLLHEMRGGAGNFQREAVETKMLSHESYATWFCRPAARLTTRDEKVRRHVCPIDASHYQHSAQRSVGSGLLVGRAGSGSLAAAAIS